MTIFFKKTIELDRQVYRRRSSALLPNGLAQRLLAAGIAREFHPVSRRNVQMAVRRYRCRLLKIVPEVTQPSAPTVEACRLADNGQCDKAITDERTCVVIVKRSFKYHGLRWKRGEKLAVTQGAADHLIASKQAQHATRDECRRS